MPQIGDKVIISCDHTGRYVGKSANIIGGGFLVNSFHRSWHLKVEEDGYVGYWSDKYFEVVGNGCWEDLLCSK